MALFPIVTGLSRRALIRRGIVSQEYQLSGMSIHGYYASSHVQPDKAIPVLLVHGIADSALTWVFTMSALRDIGPVYALDLPGFGLSGNPKAKFAPFHEQLLVLHELILTVIKRPTLVVGNSLGGWLAVQLALHFPEITQGIILLDPGGALLEGKKSWQTFIDTVAVPDLRSVRLIYRQMFGRWFLLPMLYMAQSGFQDLFKRDSVQLFIEHVTENDFIQAEELRQLRIPTGLIWGRKDRFLPTGSLKFFHDNMPNAKFLLLPRCGHLPQREQPREVIRFIQAFAGQLRAAL